MLRRLHLAWAIAAILLLACSNKPDDPPCPRQEAAFRVEVATESGEPLPPDTVVTVRYQGSQSERFILARPGRANEDVCCRAVESMSEGKLPSIPCNVAAADAASNARAIQCELWTNGIAEVNVTAEGYAPLDETLTAEMREDRCGLTTVDVRLQLQQGDAGVVE